MSHRSRTYREAAKLMEKGKLYSLGDAIGLLKGAKGAKFDETAELSLVLGIDPKDSSQVVRGTVNLPHGTGKEIKVLVLAKGEKAKEAQEAGADFVGDEELVEKVSQGWLGFDVAIATPDMMKVVGKLGRLLGPRGLMPNPKSGTVTFEVAKAVKDSKGGKVEFRNDRDGNLHLSIGKVSFAQENLIGNARAAMGAVMETRPPSARGQYVRRATLSSTMGPGIKIEVKDLTELL